MRLKEPLIRVVNVVASASLNQPVDLNAIVHAFPSVEYRPNVFPGLVFRLKKPRTATLIFNTGRMVCTGAKSEKAARQAVKRVARQLKERGIPLTKKPSIRIQNIVASAELGGQVDLESLVYRLKRVMYEPEQFPAAVYRMEEPKVVFLIFPNGKLVCVGAKTEKQLHEAVKKLHRTLRRTI